MSIMHGINIKINGLNIFPLFSSVNNIKYTEEFFSLLSLMYIVNGSFDIVT